MSAPKVPPLCATCGSTSVGELYEVYVELRRSAAASRAAAPSVTDAKAGAGDSGSASGTTSRAQLGVGALLPQYVALWATKLQSNAEAFEQLQIWRTCCRMTLQSHYPNPAFDS